MLEGLATWVLNTYLGQYLENLNTDQLSIGLLRGEVELENVPLRKDALRHLDIPLQVVSGFVGRVKLQIPVARLRSEPWVVVFEQLYGVIAPIKLEEYDEEATAAARLTRKLSQLDHLEATWRAEQATKTGEPYAAAASSWFSFGTSIATNIIENIQLRIHDVHLRYEDDQSMFGHVFACGLTIRSLTVQSTDSNWLPTFVRGSCRGTNDSEAVSHKLLELTDLALYWDTRAQLCTGRSLPQLVSALEASFKGKHQFLVQPVSATACLRRHLTAQPLKSRSTPRLACHLTMPSFPVHLTDQQFTQMVQANRLYDRLDRARHHKKYRPSGSVTGNATEWWQYAMQCHLDDIHARRLNANWEAVLERSVDLLDYVEVYTRHLNNPNTLPIEDKDLMNRLELELGFTELKALREVAMRRVEEQTPKHTPTHTGPSVPSTTPAPPPLSSSIPSLTTPQVSPTAASATVSPTSLPSSPGSLPSSTGETLLQRWFPSWRGWYSQPTATSPMIKSTFKTSDSAETELSSSVSSGALDEESASMYDTPQSSRRNSSPSAGAIIGLTESPILDISSPGRSAQSMEFGDAPIQTRHRERIISTSLEEEFLYVLSDSIENNTFTKRDAVFCHLSFTLKQGLFTLSSEKTATTSSDVKFSKLFELEFSDVKMGLESRPRNKSYKFDIELGSLLLREQVTIDSAFSRLIAPQAQQEPSSGYHHSRASRASSTAGVASPRLPTSYARSLSVSIKSDGGGTGASGKPSDGAGSNAAGTHSTDGRPLFSLTYEHCPALSSQADHKLHVVTQPLDLVYNPDAMDAATNFFLQPLKTTSKYRNTFLNAPSALSMTARKHYDALMEQTKQELRKNLNQMWQGGMRKRWAINLDISAPQIIIPAHFRDRNATLVIVDLGRLSFCSANTSGTTTKETTKNETDSSQTQTSLSKPTSWGGFMAKMFRQSAEEEQDDDEFATPCSTPDELFCDSPTNTVDPSILTQPLTEDLLHSHMYDKYELKLCDMQVLVCKVRENWRFAYHRGTGPMHVVDRFSISVLVSRRMVSVLPSDRPWPTATLMATLPSIMLHLNQVKVQALLSLAQTISHRSRNSYATQQAEQHSYVPPNDQVSSSRQTLARSETAATLLSVSREALPEDVESSGKYESTPFAEASRRVRSHPIRQDSAEVTDSSSSMHDDSRLLVMQLNIEKLSIELVSRGRSIAEVQITGVKGIIQHRPYNYSASLTIHSLLLVDALQTFGPDFELLVASHKHISMDSVSGSLLDSELCSPVSPASPDHHTTHSLCPTSPVMLTRALHALATSPTQSKIGRGQRLGSNPFFPRGLSSPPGVASPPGGGVDVGEVDSEALICVEVTYVSPECPTHEGSGPLLMGSLQFNTIDIIANQETIVELVGFIHQLMPAANSSKELGTSLMQTSFEDSKNGEFSPSVSSKSVSGEAMSNSGRQSMYGSLAMLYTPTNPEVRLGADDDLEPQIKEPLRVEMCFDFTKLSVLLLRAAVKDREVVGRKVATAVLSQAKIQTTLANHQLSVEGSLGGFQVRDITPEPNKHQCIISVGQDFQIEKQQDIISRLTTGLYQSYAEKESESVLKAFSFSVQRPLVFGSSCLPDVLLPRMATDDSEKLTVTLQLASVLYTHSPSFLQEVSSCAEEFKQYMARLAQGIKHAATEMAMGLVSKRIESFAVLPGYSSPGGKTGGGIGGGESPLLHRRSLSRSIDTLHLPQPPPATASHTSPTHAPPSDLTFRLRLSVVLETPIVVLPESSTSSGVVVAQLGQISVQNADCGLTPPDRGQHESAEGQFSRSVPPGTFFPSEDVMTDERTATDNDEDSVIRVVKYKVSIRDMSLYSLDIDDRKSLRATSTTGPSVRCAADLYRCGVDCAPIVHSTSAQLIVSHQRSPALLPDSHAGMYYFPADVFHAMDDDLLAAATAAISSGNRGHSDTVEVTGGVVATVKLSASRKQYRQLILTLGNISVAGSKSGSSAAPQNHSLDCILEESHLPVMNERINKGHRPHSLSGGDAHKMATEDTTGTSDETDRFGGDAQQHLAVLGEFTVPRVEVELIGDVNASSQPLVNLILEDFRATYQNNQPYQTTTKVTLKSLVLEDLQCPENSPHRYLLQSVEPPAPPPTSDNASQQLEPNSLFAPPFVSTSCPDFKRLMNRNDPLSHSLPARLELEKPFFKAQQRPTTRSSARRKRKRFRQMMAGSSMSLADMLSEQSTGANSDQEAGRKCPYTPPPSPIPTNQSSSLHSPDNTSNLVRINVLTVDSNSPDFVSKYDGTDRFVDVAFNSLVAVVNIPSWVMMLDFFSSKQRRESSTLFSASSSCSKDGTGVSNVQEVQDPVVIPDTNDEDQSEERGAELNTVVEMSVVWLELVLVRVDGSGNLGAEVAGASVSNVSVRSIGTVGDLSLSGCLGSLAVTDRTPHGQNYKQKFLTSGKEALTFQLFQYGHPDPKMLRECDMRLNIKMSSVMYIHTQRFATELLHVIQQFNQLQTIVEKWRAIRAGQQVQDNSRGSRMSLSVTAGSPVIFLPLCAEGSDQILVADLGALGINNKFLWAGAQGTISKIDREGLHERLSSGRTTSRSRSRPNRSRSRSIGRSRSRHNTSENIASMGKPPKCLLDVLDVKLSNMDLYAAKRVDYSPKIMKKRRQRNACSKWEEKKSGALPSKQQKSHSIPIPGTKSANEHSVFSQVSDSTEDDFSNEVSWEFSDFFVLREGHPLLREKCALTLQVERNLDSHVSKRVPDVSVQGCVSKVHATVDEETYKLIRGLLQFNLGEDLTELHIQQERLHHPHLPLHANVRQPECDEDIHITLNIALDLDNVTVETLFTPTKTDTTSDSFTVPLTCVNLIKSRLLYQANSEGGNDVDLVSQEILISDTRFLDCPVNKRSNVFNNILQPTPVNTAKNEGLLQAEVHYRSTKEVTRFTILLNNMRLMAIMDWWVEVLAFIQLSPPNPHQNSCINAGGADAALSHITNELRRQTSSTQHTPQLLSSNTTPLLFSATPSSGMSPRSTSPAPHLSGSRNVSRKSSGFGRASPRLNPLVESTGVMTKHSLIDDFEKENREGSGAVGFDHEDMIPFELKINITDSEIVIVEDPAQCNSNALILKNTTVLSYRPSLSERPVSCNLSQCEVYSCVLSAEEDSALSILDPITINIEMTDRGSQQQPDLARGAMLSVHHVVEISLHQVNLRLSYHDLKMFQRILESVPWVREEASSQVPGDQQEHPANVKAQMNQLSVLGFSRTDCCLALRECSGRLDEAALWLTLNATPAPANTIRPLSSVTADRAINCQALEIKTGSVNLCFIDDCGDCDVPLLEFSLVHLNLKQNRNWSGSACCTLVINYYNRFLSGWEPFLEPWKCSLEWNKKALCGGRSRGARLSLQLAAEETMELNVTSSLLELFRMVKSSWTQDYYNRDRFDGKEGLRNSSAGSPINYRRRSPFIPFTLLNQTGSSLSFTTFTAFTHGDGASSSPQQRQEWLQVAPEEAVPFSFDNYRNSKLRHGDTHDHKMHQIGVCVSGWHPVGPVTVDKVGTFFRMAHPMASATTSAFASARVVVCVSLAGSARKLVTVRSALLLHNALPTPIEARLENLANKGGDIKMLQVASQSTIAVPLAYVWAGIRVRPLGGGIRRTLSRSNNTPGRSSSGNGSRLAAGNPGTVAATAAGMGSGGWVHYREPVHWRTMTAAKEQYSELKCCPAINAYHPPYRFCVHIRRENYPVDSPQGSLRPPTPPLLLPHHVLQSRPPTPQEEWVQPAHTITLVSPLTLVNLLPFDLHYNIPSSAPYSAPAAKSSSTSSAFSLPPNKGLIRPGNKAIMHSVDPEEGVKLRVWTDTFLMSSDVSISGTSVLGSSLGGGSGSHVVPLQLHDSAGRVLQLQLRVTRCYGKTLKLSVFALYWLINKTGLPLIFRQEGCSTDAAGQEDEHEMARCCAPLLFSFSEREAGQHLTFRVGQHLHPHAQPHSCHHLRLTPGTCVRRVRVTLSNNRPDIVYIIGVDVRPGRGRYRDTYMVTLSPRFQVENRSSHELLLAQMCSTDASVAGGENTWLRSLPGSFLAFHWPRLDKDQLISLKILSGHSGYWSGGFTIEKIDSFHLNIRGPEGESRFVRVETLIRDATYFLVITDADTFPPPFRIDNFSEVAISYYQTGTQFPHLRSQVRPRCSVAYAWDEPTMKPYLTCVAPGGVSATYNLNELREGAKLTYENFIYIAFTGTFQNLEACAADVTEGASSPMPPAEEGDNIVCLDPCAVECQQLVMDVVEGTKVQLARKQMGKRSQLWRMTSTGRLQHEGSSSPTDPTQPRKNDANTLVLDISGTAPQPRSYTPLMLRRPDPRRQLTQTWQFTEDGRLCCKHHNLYVQARDGFLGLTPGNSVVLGPAQCVEYGRLESGVAIEQAVSRQRLRPGSGILALKVVADGPTRALQVTDFHIKNQPVVARTETGELVTLCGTADTSSPSAQPREDQEPSSSAAVPVNAVVARALPGHIEELQVQVSAKGGVGVSVVQQSPPQELVYVRLSDILLDYNSSPSQRTLDATVRDIQVDNQVSESSGEGSVLVFVTPQSRTDDTRHLPSLTLALHQLVQPRHAANALVFKNLRVCLKNLSLTLEEEVVCRLLVLAGYHLDEDGVADGTITGPGGSAAASTDPLHESRTSIQAATSATGTRYYFGLLELQLKQVRLSVLTSKQLSAALRNVRRRAGLNSLVRFENAQVNLDSFVRVHPFETAHFLWDSICKHYTEELSSQAVRILGSTDFLGNPSGLLADVSEGMSELMHEGSLQGFVWNVTHGMANSAAKVSGSLSDGLGRVIMDEAHETLRQRLATRNDGGGGTDQFMNGLRGLGLGLYGGITSIAVQTFAGVQQEGVPGLFSGFAKGVVGTVTKPAVGVLDLFSSTAYAVRDSSRTPLCRSVQRVRPGRVVVGLTGLLPRYCHSLARGQQLLRTMPHYSPNEIVVAYERLRVGAEDMRVLVSSERVRVFSHADVATSPNIVLTATYTEIVECRPVVLTDPLLTALDGENGYSEHQRYYVELTMAGDPRLPSVLHATKKPKVRCDSQDISQKVSREINCARNLYAELWQTVFEEGREEDD